MKNLKIAMNVLPIEKSDWTVDQWASELRTWMYRANEDLYELGRRLNDIVTDLKKGILPADFKGTKKNWKHAYGDILKVANLAPHDAGILCRFAERTDLQNRLSQLPPSLHAIGVIIRLDESEVTPLLEDGTINPGTTQAEAKKIVHTIYPPKKKKVSTGVITPVDKSSSLDMAHDVYLELKPKAFIAEIINLIADKPRVSFVRVIEALQEESK